MASFIVSKDKKFVKADTKNSAFQLWNEGVNKDQNPFPMREDTWYTINGEYGLWILENEFPNIKGGEFINVIYE